MGISRPRAAATLTLAALVLIAVGLGAPSARNMRLAASDNGSIRGRVVTSGAIPPGTLKVTTDEKVCGLSVADEAVVVDKSGNVANAVVTIKGLAWSGPPSSAHVINRGCRFAPHVAVARPGTTIEVDSEDQTLHTTHLYAADGRSLFNVALPMPGITIKRPLDKHTGVLRLACDTHPWMRGFLAVTADRSVVTGSDGRFQVDDVPAGSREISVWHEGLRAAPQKVAVVAGQAAEVMLTLVAR